MHYRENEITRLILRMFKNKQHLLFQLNDIKTFEEFVQFVDDSIETIINTNYRVFGDNPDFLLLNGIMNLAIENILQTINYEYLYDELLFEENASFTVEVWHITAYADWCLENHVVFDSNPSLDTWIKDQNFYKTFVDSKRKYY